MSRLGKLDAAHAKRSIENIERLVEKENPDLSRAVFQPPRRRALNSLADPEPDLDSVQALVVAAMRDPAQAMMSLAGVLFEKGEH